MAKRRCTATTKAGKRCRRRPAAGGGRCAVHSGGQLDGLTPAVQERVCQALRAGAHMEQAATFAGVHRATVHRWLARGESDDAPERFRDFAAAVREAEAGFEIASLALIARAGDEDWRARAWLVERRHPRRWGRRKALELSGPDGEPIQLEALGLDWHRLTDEELDFVAQLYAKAGRGRG
jgi:hypothetical protein